MGTSRLATAHPEGCFCTLIQDFPPHYVDLFSISCEQHDLLLGYTSAADRLVFRYINPTTVNR